jgi:hypothetical protein
MDSKITKKLLTVDRKPVEERQVRVPQGLIAAPTQSAVKIVPVA